MARHIYVHIPFCLKKCPYCAFASVAVDRIPQDEYIAALIAELDLKAVELPADRVATVFLGGGTPSMLSAGAIGRLLEALDRVWGMDGDAEISIEANPETVHLQWASDVRTAGINRISLGAQTFSDRLLAGLGRIHSAGRTIEAYDDLRAAGFDNLNLDIIYGIPEQTRPEVLADLDQVCRLAPEHVSAYMFQHEIGTAFETVSPQAEGVLEEFFYETLGTLRTAGLMQYEISNFARTGRQCRHNRAYWAYKAYVGLGAGAVDCRVTGRRERNIADPAEYMRRLRHGAAVVEEVDVLDEREMAFERDFLALRTIEGLPADRMPLAIPRKYYLIRDGRAVLTPEGMLVSDAIFAML